MVSLLTWKPRANSCTVITCGGSDFWAPCWRSGTSSKESVKKNVDVNCLLTCTTKLLEPLGSLILKYETMITAGAHAQTSTEVLMRIYRKICFFNKIVHASSFVYVGRTSRRRTSFPPMGSNYLLPSLPRDESKIYFQKESWRHGEFKASLGCGHLQTFVKYIRLKFLNPTFYICRQQHPLPPPSSILDVDGVIGV